MKKSENIGNEDLIPYITKEDRVILFDGVCNFCTFWSKFILRYDRNKFFKLCAMQSEKGREILRHFSLPENNYETLILIEENKLITKSSAVLKIANTLPFPWKAGILLKIIPTYIRDIIYDFIASNRYRVFGKRETCILPTKEEIERFI